ncbi:MAG: serine/threonine-protein phosphatase [Magnetococcus sp. YQC-5]
MSGTVMEVRPGDRVIVYTDGIVEEINRNEEAFGSERLELLLNKIVGSEEPLEIVVNALEAFRQGRKQKDDVTLIELSC